MPTFKVQKQVYHQIGSVQPVPGETQFSRIYFMDNVVTEIDWRSAFRVATDRIIITELRGLFHEH